MQALDSNKRPRSARSRNRGATGRACRHTAAQHRRNRCDSPAAGMEKFIRCARGNDATNEGNECNAGPAAPLLSLPPGRPCSRPPSRRRNNTATTPPRALLRPKRRRRQRQTPQVPEAVYLARCHHLQAVPAGTCWRKPPHRQPRPPRQPRSNPGTRCGPIAADGVVAKPNDNSANNPGKILGLKPIVAPALPISADQQAQLQALLEKYEAGTSRRWNTRPSAKKILNQPR